MAKQSRILELVSVIESRTLLLEEYFRNHDLPEPSLTVHAQPRLPLPPDLAKSREEVLDASSELQALLQGPLAHLTRLTSPTASISPTADCCSLTR